MRRRAARFGAMAFVFVACLALGGGASADRRTDYLIGLLQTSSTFRVRAQAALSLGRLEGSRDIVRALIGALDDDHPAVRTAAAASLERLSDPSALDALRAKARDRDPGVRRAVASAIRSLSRVARTAPTTSSGSSGSSGSSTPGPSADSRYYVGVGVPGSRVDGIDRGTLEQTRQFIVRQLAQMDGVAIAPESESSAAANRVIRGQNLHGFYLDASITSVEQTSAGLRVAVSVIVGTYPGRDMRAMLNGAATVPGGSGPQARQVALEGALRSALRRLPQAMAAAAR